MARRIAPKKQQRKEISIKVNGAPVVAYVGETVATALMAADIYQLRTSPRNGMPRGPFCFMGTCQECLIQIDGKPQLACQTRVSETMSVVIGYACE